MYDINHTYAVQNSDGTVSSYHVPDLWKIAQHFPTTQKPLEYWVGRINNYINAFTPEDWLRVIEADLSYPIILYGKAGVADGSVRRPYYVVGMSLSQLNYTQLCILDKDQCHSVTKLPSDRRIKEGMIPTKNPRLFHDPNNAKYIYFARQRELENI